MATPFQLGRRDYSKGTAGLTKEDEEEEENDCVSCCVSDCTGLDCCADMDEKLFLEFFGVL